MSPCVCVIVLTWNSEKYLDACLSALSSQEVANSETLVVDNASTDGSLTIAQKYTPPIRIIHNERNLGFAGGNNVGIQATDSDIIVLLNPDTVVQPGWLRFVIETFQDASIGIVGCKALYPDGKHIQHAGAVLQPDTAFGQHIGSGEIDNGQYDQLTDSEYVTGAAFGVHRKVLNRIGGLDEEFYPAFYEETDYCYRARRAGFRIVYQPKAVLYHHETASLPAQSLTRTSAYHRNRLRFVLRHWNSAELQKFMAAESHAVEISLILDDLVARAKAYWDNVLELSPILTQRQHDSTLGGALALSESRWLFDSLQQLRRLAIQRVFTLTLDPSECLRRAEAGEMLTRGIGSQEPMNLTSLQDTSQDLEKRYFLQEPHLTTRIPILGSLVDYFYNLWIKVAVRRYVAPLLYQQSQLNSQIIRLLGALQQIMIAQESAVGESLRKSSARLEKDEQDRWE